MAIVEVTETGASVGTPIKFTTGAKAAQNDTILFTAVPGVLPVYAATGSNASTGLISDAFKYNIVCCAATVSTTTGTSVTYDGATASTRTSGGWFAYNATSGEIMYVVVDSDPTGTSGTLTVIRGCLGTSAATIADNEYLHILNSVILTSATTGKEIVAYIELPHLPKANVL